MTSIMGQEIKIAPLKGCNWVKNFELEKTKNNFVHHFYTTQDSKTKNNQKNDTFWDRVFKHYNKYQPSQFMCREASSTIGDSKWGMIKYDVAKLM